jgi:DNA polymerase theta
LLPRQPQSVIKFSHFRISPEKLIQDFSALGINNIYPWQSKCLLESRLLKGEVNLVYTAPTGGYKSLVADALMPSQVVDNPQKKAILVLPHIALLQEKIHWLNRLSCQTKVLKNEKIY